MKCTFAYTSLKKNIYKKLFCLFLYRYEKKLIQTCSNIKIKVLKEIEAMLIAFEQNLTHSTLQSAQNKACEDRPKTPSFNENGQNELLKALKAHILKDISTY